MSTLFEKATTWLKSKLAIGAGITVTYTRSSTSLSITAVVGRTVFNSGIDGPGLRIEYGERDYLITASALASLGEPQLGDRITETVGGATRVFEVMQPSSGDPPWRWSDPAMIVYRIHVKQVS